MKVSKPSKPKKSVWPNNMPGRPPKLPAPWVLTSTALVKKGTGYSLKASKDHPGRVDVINNKKVETPGLCEEGPLLKVIASVDDVLDKIVQLAAQQSR